MPAPCGKASATGAPRWCRSRCARSAPRSARRWRAPPAGGRTGGANTRGRREAERQPAPAVPRALTATEQAARQRALVEQQREVCPTRGRTPGTGAGAGEDFHPLGGRGGAPARGRGAQGGGRGGAAAKPTKWPSRPPRTLPARRPRRPSAAQAAAPAAAGARRHAAGRPRPRQPPHRRLRPRRCACGPVRVGRRRTRRGPSAAPAASSMPRKPQTVVAKKGTDAGRRAGRIDVQAAIEGEDERVRSLASVRRQRERERRQAELERLRSDQVKVVRDVISAGHHHGAGTRQPHGRARRRGDQGADETRRHGDNHPDAGRRHRRTWWCRNSATARAACRSRTWR